MPVERAEFTKFMYVTGGGGHGRRTGIDEQLMARAKAWGSAFYPRHGLGGIAKRDRI